MRIPRVRLFMCLLAVLRARKTCHSLSVVMDAEWRSHQVRIGGLVNGSLAHWAGHSIEQAGLADGQAKRTFADRCVLACDEPRQEHFRSRGLRSSSRTNVATYRSGRHIIRICVSFFLFFLLSFPFSGWLLIRCIVLIA